MANQDMLINFVRGEECRIAIVEDGKLEELYTERTSADLHVGNIYRGRVTNVEPSIQAAFVDFGLERSGFLHISDLHPRFFPGEDREQTERVGHKTPRRERPPIQQALKRGQMLPVQVLKEGIGTKGPTVSSYLSIPGRFLVMMPYMERHGVSRKIEDEEKRREMRRILDELDPPEDLGFIVRTAGFGRPKSELKRDLNYLLRLWKDIQRRMKRGRGPVELYAESDLIIRTLRDVITSDVKRIIVDDRVPALRAKQFLKLASPRTTTNVIHYRDNVPLFDAFDIERQIQQINARTVPLDSGGSLVIDQTEAMVSIDVNSGKFRDKKDPEQTAFLTNQQAIDEIARQLRLRDLGGLIVLDLIDMYANRHRREIERRFREDLKKDRARTKVLKISELGLLEMTRQRMRPSLKKSIYDECRFCTGTGQVLSPESVALEVMRRVAVAAHASRVARIELTAHPDVLAMLLNRRRHALAELETDTAKPIRFAADASFGPDQVDLKCLDAGGHAIDPDRLPRIKAPRFAREDELTVKDLDELDEELRLPALEDEEEAEPQPPQEEGGTKRKRRRRRRRKSDQPEPAAAAEAAEPRPGERAEGDEPATDEAAERKDTEKTRGRSRGRGRSAQPVSGGYEGAAQEPAPASANAEQPEAAEAGADNSDTGDTGEEGESRRRRRRRRGGRRRRRNRSEDEQAQTSPAEPADDQQPVSSEADADTPQPAASDASSSGDSAPTPQPSAPPAASPDATEATEATEQPAKKPRAPRRRKRTTRTKAAAAPDGEGAEASADTENVADAEKADQPTRKKRRTRKRTPDPATVEGEADANGGEATDHAEHNRGGEAQSDAAEAAPASGRGRGRRRRSTSGATGNGDASAAGSSSTPSESSPSDGASS